MELGHGAKDAPPNPPRRYVGLRVLSVALGVCVLAATAVTTYLATPSGRARAKQAVEARVNAEIRGRLVIGRMDALSFGSTSLRHVALFDPSGLRVVSLDRVDVRFDPQAALGGILHLQSVQGLGGWIHLEDGDTESPSLLESFAPRHVDRAKPRERLVVDELRLDSITVYGKAGALRGLHAQDVHARGKIETTDHGEIRLDDLTGRIVGPWPFEIALAGGRGRISEDPMRGLHLRARGHLTRDTVALGSLRLDFQVRVLAGTTDGRPLLRSRLAFEALAPAALVAVGFEEARAIRVPLSGTFDTIGGGDRWDLAVALRTDGGFLRTRAAIRGDALTLDAETPRLDLGAVLEGAPAVTLIGLIGHASASAPAGIRGPVQISADLAETQIDARTVPPVTFRGAFESGRLRIDSVRAEDDTIRLDGAGTVDSAGPFDVRVRGRVPELATHGDIQRALRGLRGATVVTATLRGDFQRRTLDARAHVDLVRASFAGARAGRLVADVVARGSLDDPTFVLDGEAREVRIQDVPVQRLALHLHGRPSDVRGTLAFDAAPGLHGDLEVSAELTNARRSGVRLDIPSATLTTRGQSGATWTGHARGVVLGNGGSLAVDEVLLVRGGSEIHAAGSLSRTGTLSLRAGARDLDLAMLRPWLGLEWTDLAGHADIEGTAEGPMHALTASATGTLRGATVRGLSPLSGTFEGGASPGHLRGTADLGVGDAGHVVVSLTGLLDTTATRPRDMVANAIYHADVRLQGFDLGHVHGFGAPPLLGIVTGEIVADGPLFAPTLRASISATGLSIRSLPPVGVSASLSYESGAFDGNVRIADEHGELAEVEGSLLMDLVSVVTDPHVALASLEMLPWRVAVRVVPRTVETLPPWIRSRLPEAPSLGPLEIAVSGTAAGGSQPIRADVEAFARWTQPTADRFCGRELRPRASLRFEIREGIARGQLRGFLGPLAVLEANLSGPAPLEDWLASGLPETPPALDGTVRIPRLAFNAVPGLCSRASGELSLDASFTGLLGPSPGVAISASVPALGIPDSEPMSLAISARLDVARAQLSGLAAWPSGDRATVAASVPIAWQTGELVPSFRDDALEGQFAFHRTPVDLLGLAGTVLDDLTGKVDGELAIGGSLLRPSVTGTVALSDGYVAIAGVGQRLTDVHGLLVFHPGWVELDGFEARDGDGRVRISGGFGFNGIRPTRTTLAIHANNFPVRREGSVIATVSGNADLGARIGRRRLNMAIDTRSLDIRLPEQATRSVQELASHPDFIVVGAAATDAEEVQPFPIRVRARAREPFWVRRDDFAVQIASELDIAYEDPGLRVGGFVELRRGYLEIFGKRFVIDRGSMQFDGTPVLDPTVSLVATHTLRGTAAATVTIAVSGRLSAPDVAFSSTESNSREEIIALLVTGQHSITQSTDETPSPEAEATRFLAGLTTGLLTLGLRRELGNVLDLVAVELGDNQDSARLRLGRQMNELIPGFLRSVVTGVYFEGQFVGSIGADPTEDPTTSSTTTSGFEGGLVELQFPRSLFGTFHLTVPSNWSVDVTWEP